MFAGCRETFFFLAARAQGCVFMPSEPTDPFLVGASGIDGEALLHQIRVNASRRTPLRHVAAALGWAQLREERRALGSVLEELKQCMGDYGRVDTHRCGWLGRVELLVKRGIRKLFSRHILQQQCVHVKVMTFLEQVMGYLETSDQSWRASVDHCERKSEDASVALLSPVERVRSLSHPSDRNSDRPLQPCSR
jgi:hypothetical protein